MERDTTEQAPVFDWGAVPNGDLARWLGTVLEIGTSGLPGAELEASAIIEEAARRLRGRDGGTVA